MNKKFIYDFDLEDLELSPKFRAKQLFNWLYTKYANNFLDMKNLPKDFIEKLEEKYIINSLKVKKEVKSKDGTIKYLFETIDGYTFEAVFLKMRDEEISPEGNVIKGAKYTFCVSSQIGCKVGCAFCMTGKGGFVRNLRSGEIVEQVVLLKRLNNLPSNKSVNIVFMGMGEPLDNFDNVIKAIKIISNLDGLAISTRRQTISTSGIAPKIEALGKLDLGVQLAISLHAVDDDLRSALVPMNRAYNIEKVLEVVRNFPIDLRKRVMFEYIVIKNLNDDLNSAKKLLKLLNGIKSKINLILFNPHIGSEFQRPNIDDVKKFADFLISKGQLCTIRESKGLDIDAACGQLKEKDKNDKGKNVSYETLKKDI